MNQIYAEAYEYFKSTKLERLIEAIVAKYEVYGQWKGNVTLYNLSEEEIDDITGFFRMNFKCYSPLKISVKDFILAYSKTKFRDIPLLNLFELILNRHIKTNEQKAIDQKTNEEAFINTYLNTYSKSINCILWLNSLLNSPSSHRVVWSLFRSNPTYCNELVDANCRALSILDGNRRREHLSVFSNKITSNPHSFDLGKSVLGKIFFQSLQTLNKGRLTDSKQETNVEEIHGIYLKYGLTKESYFNNVATCGIIAYDKLGKVLPMFEAACQNNLPYISSIREIEKIERAKPYNSSQVIYITENPSVFETIINYWDKDIYPPLICSAGNLNLATLKLIRSLQKNGFTLMYSGDFDPEGLLIADKLYELFPESMNLWRMTTRDYLNHCNSSTVQITDKKRLSKLKGIKNKYLKEVKNVFIKKKCYAVFEEQLIDLLLKDLKENPP